MGSGRLRSRAETEREMAPPLGRPNANTGSNSRTLGAEISSFRCGQADGAISA
jgi:hypothetical protein